jgi:hypothetical protein
MVTDELVAYHEAGHILMSRLIGRTKQAEVKRSSGKVTTEFSDDVAQRLTEEKYSLKKCIERRGYSWSLSEIKDIVEKYPALSLYIDLNLAGIAATFIYLNRKKANTRLTTDFPIWGIGADEDIKNVFKLFGLYESRSERDLYRAVDKLISERIHNLTQTFSALYMEELNHLANDLMNYGTLSNSVIEESIANTLRSAKIKDTFSEIWSWISNFFPLFILVVAIIIFILFWLKKC